MPWGAFASGSVLAVVGGLAARYASERNRIERSWVTEVAPKLTSIGEVDQLSIILLVERLVPLERLLGEPGVSYLLRAGPTTLLFDSGQPASHPGIERMLAIAERVLDVPVKGVIGGLHLPAHSLGTPLLLQATRPSPRGRAS
jgi:hypothetical protein